MSRRLTAPALLLVVEFGALCGVAAAETTSSSPPPSPLRIDGKTAQGRAGLDYEVGGGGTEAVESEEAGGSAGVAGRVGPRRWFATVPVLATRPDGQRCMSWVRRSYPDPAAAEAAAAIVENFRWRVTEGGFLTCQSPDAPPEPTPASEASAYWRVVGRDLLPEPSPRIAPGYMLAGKLAYLEAGSQTTARFEHPTPLGTLVIDATSRLYVDWGDGSGLTGPHEGPGRPWPDGRITHYWTDAATYDVTVTQRWTGRWTLGAAAGTVDGMETKAVIDDFEVRQLQAVRNW